MDKSEYDIREIAGGWSVHAVGWAVHGATKSEAITLFESRKDYRMKLAKLPFWHLNPDNPENKIKPSGG